MVYSLIRYPYIKFITLTLEVSSRVLVTSKKQCGHFSSQAWSLGWLIQVLWYLILLLIIPYSTVNTDTSYAVHVTSHDTERLELPVCMPSSLSLPLFISLSSELAYTTTTVQHYRQLIRLMYVPQYYVRLELNNGAPSSLYISLLYI